MADKKETRRKRLSIQAFDPPNVVTGPMKTVRKVSLVALGAMLCWGYLLGHCLGQSKEAIAIDTIAGALQRGKFTKAKKLARELAKKEKEVYEVMRLFKKDHSKFGPSRSLPETDHMERYLRKLAIRGIKPQVLAAQSRPLARMGYRIAAVAEFCDCKEVFPRVGKRPGQRGIDIWKGSVREMREGVQDFIQAVRNTNAANVKSAARRVYGACNRCHETHR